MNGWRSRRRSVVTRDGTEIDVASLPTGKYMVVADVVASLRDVQRQLDASPSSHDQYAADVVGKLADDFEAKL